MPKFGNVISSLQAKIEEARISDLNYELGKLVQDTKCYISSTFKGSGGVVRGSVPKSTSLPLFPSTGFGRNNGLPSDEYPVESLTGKYKYRSSFRPPSDEDILGTAVIEEEEDEDELTNLADSTVVEKFIKVIETSSAPQERTPENTREDIRRKLAFGKPEGTPKVKKVTNDLEVCFINEIHEEETNDVLTSVRPKPLTRSQSECVSIVQRSLTDPGKATNVAYQLARCKQVAHRKMMIEKRNRTFHEVNTFNKLIGRSLEGRLDQEILSQMNTATIQVIVNDFHNKIERLNEELVRELMKKDELQVIFHECVSKSEIRYVLEFYRLNKTVNWSILTT